MRLPEAQIHFVQRLRLRPAAIAAAPERAIIVQRGKEEVSRRFCHLFWNTLWLRAVPPVAAWGLSTGSFQLFCTPSSWPSPIEGEGTDRRGFVTNLGELSAISGQLSV